MLAVLCTYGVNRAAGRPDVDRPIAYSTGRKPEDIDEDASKIAKKRKTVEEQTEAVTELLVDAIRTITKTQTDTLEYQKARDERLDSREAEWNKLEAERLRRETEEADLRTKRELDTLRSSKIAQYKVLIRSDEGVDCVLARTLAEEIKRDFHLDIDIFT